MTDRNCGKERGASFRKLFKGEYKMSVSIRMVPVKDNHMILSFMSRRVERIKESRSELMT